MADKWAVQNGAWSDPATWNDNTKPSPEDDVYADGYTVTIDENITVRSIANWQRTGGARGGQFILKDGVEITAEEVRSTNDEDCIVFDDPDGEAIVNANLIGGGGDGDSASQSWIAPVVLKSGKLTVNGDVGVWGNQYRAGLRVESGVLLINGNVRPFATPGNMRASGVVKTTSGEAHITVTGNVEGMAITGYSEPMAGVYFRAGSGTITVGGDVKGGQGVTGGRAVGIRVDAGCAVSKITIGGDVRATAPTTGNGRGIEVLQQTECDIEIAGSVYAGSATTGTCEGVASYAAGTIEIGGSVYGGTVTTGAGHGLLAPAPTSVTIEGDAVGGTATAAGDPAGVRVASGTLVVQGDAVGGTASTTAGNAPGVAVEAGRAEVRGSAIAGDHSNAVCPLGNGAVIKVIGPAVSHPSGAVPIGRGYILLDESEPFEWEFRTSIESPGTRKLYTANAFSALPQTKDVRAGVTYGPSGELKGTLAVPPKEAVGAGVPVDDTVGEAALSEVTIQNAIIPIVP